MTIESESCVSLLESPAKPRGVWCHPLTIRGFQTPWAEHARKQSTKVSNSRSTNEVKVVRSVVPIHWDGFLHTNKSTGDIFVRWRSPGVPLPNSSYLALQVCVELQWHVKTAFKAGVYSLADWPRHVDSDAIIVLGREWSININGRSRCATDPRCANHEIWPLWELREIRVDAKQDLEMHGILDTTSGLIKQ
jgi:hypothetical protein